MVKRTIRKKTKKVKRVIRRRKPVKKAKKANSRVHWDAYKKLQKRVDEAWVKLRKNVKKKASPQILVQDKNHLLLLLGECNYMARECTRWARKRK